ncbi:MAG TPA: DUF1569 domain-containing protein [Flavobacteriales bacterium]|nr:DUF1569 domain-containing protein [Flavobacteriales bacterium]
MRSLFDRTDVDHIVERIANLKPDSKALRGTMYVDQMLAHCQQPLRVALGELKPKRTLLGALIGPIAKKKLTTDQPWAKDMPTDKAFLIIDRRKFADEQRRLSEIIRRFNAGGPEGLSKTPHPFFGKLTVREWDALMSNHLDHHLRQFGV